MANLTIVSPSLAGTVSTPLAAAAGGDSFLNDGDTVLLVTNGGVAPITLTVVTQYADGNLPLTDLAIAVANATSRMVGPFPTRYFNDTLGMVQLTYSAVTSLTVRPIRQR